MRSGRKFLVMLVAMLVGCSKNEERKPRDVAPAPASSLAAALHLDASFDEIEDPVAPAGDLKAELDRFTTLDACVKARAEVDPLVADALGAIGYETFLRDACRVLDAAKASDTKRCAAIDASSLRARCESVVAMTAGDAERCPLVIAAAPQRGRDAMCIAVASHDERLCAATEPSNRTTCAALVRHEDKPCGASAGRERASCLREFERWRNVLAAPPENKGAPLPKAKAKLAIAGRDGTPDPAQPETDVTIDVERGLVVYEARDGTRIDVGPMRELGPGFLAPPPNARPSLGVSLVLPRGAKDNAAMKVDRAELSVPGAATIVSPPAKGSLAVNVSKLDRARGGEIKLVLEGDASGGAHAYHVRAEIETFVRDVVKLR